MIQSVSSSQRWVYRGGYGDTIREGKGTIQWAYTIPSVTREEQRVFHKILKEASIILYSTVYTSTRSRIRIRIWPWITIHTGEVVGLSLDLNPVCLRVNATNLDQDLDQNPHVKLGLGCNLGEWYTQNKHFLKSIRIPTPPPPPSSMGVQHLLGPKSVLQWNPS